MHKFHHSISKYKCVKLESLTEINIGKTPSRKDRENFGVGSTWISISDINNIDKFIGSSKEEISEKGIDSSNINLVKQGTLLFSYKLSIGKVAIAQKDLYTNEAIAALPIKDKSKTSKNYLFYVLRHFDYTGRSDKAAKGKTLNKAKLKTLQIPLPPLPVQQRIAAILDQADELRRKDQELIDHYEQLSQSLFLEMFGDPVTNPMGWEKIELGLITNIVTKGSSPKWQGFGYVDEGKRFITSENVRLGYLDISNDKFISPEFYRKLKRSQLKLNDLLVNLVGASIGRGALVTKASLPANINQAVAKIELKQKSIIPLFALYMIITPSMQLNLIGNKVEGARANISLKNIKEFKVILPPIALQNQFAERVQVIEQQKQQAEQAARYSEELFQSFLQRAFKGELVAAGRLA